MKMEISEKIVSDIPAPTSSNQVHYFSGATLKRRNKKPIQAPQGFGVRVTANGVKSFVWYHRVDGHAHLETIARWPDVSVKAAIDVAKNRIELILKGTVDPLPKRAREKKVEALTVNGLLDKFVERYVQNRLRSETTVRQCLDQHVRPHIGKRSIYDLKRSDISRMLDDVADRIGEPQADRCLSYIRKAFNWFEINGHDDDFRSPVVPGMARTNPVERARDRVLSDDEIRAFWKATGDYMNPFNPMLRFTLLTACRRTEAAAMVSGEIVGDDWIIPAARYKTKKEHLIPLSEAAQNILNAMPAKKDGDFIFSVTGQYKLSNFNFSKKELDRDCGFSDWTIHDLRRTASTRMSKAKVPWDHTERALGHVIPGVRRVYDRYDFYDEKQAAFETLAATVDGIISAGTL
jgi:integrase